MLAFLAVALGPLSLAVWATSAGWHAVLALAAAGCIVLALVGAAIVRRYGRAARLAHAFPRSVLAASVLGLASILFAAQVSGALVAAPTGDIQSSLDVQPPSSAPPFSFHFQSGVGNDERAAVRDGIAAAQAFFLRTFGTNVKRPVIVDVRDSQPASDPFGGVTNGHHILLYTGDSPDDPNSAFAIEQGAAHELFHVLQNELSGDRTNGGTPNWLVEGSAELVADATMIDANLVDHEDVVDCRSWRLRTGSRLPPLEALSAFGTMYDARGDSYALAAIAADRLTGQTGLASLGRFFALLSQEPWQNAFQDAFQTDPAAFYQQFAAFRATLRTPAYFPCSYEYDGGPND